MHPELKTLLKRQRYRIVGNHSAVKLCHWLRRSLLEDRFCYKQKFYGIKSHRCLQMTPSVTACTQKCLFCWRPTQFTETQLREHDSPDFIILDKTLAGEAIRIAKTNDITYYDAVHITLSQRHKSALVTEDKELLRKFRNAISMKDALERIEKEPKTANNHNIDRNSQ